MANINNNIIMQAGSAVANATNKAAGLSASTPEPGSIISAIQLVNGGRELGPAALAHFTESVRNKLLSLLVKMEFIQSGSGTPSPDNVRPISGRTGLHVYVSPTQDAADATTYSVDWTSEAGTVYRGTLDVVTGQLNVTHSIIDLGNVNWDKDRNRAGVFYGNVTGRNSGSDVLACSEYTVRNLSVTTDVNMYVSGYSSYGGGAIFVRDTRFASNTAAEYKAGAAGIKVVYELATPLTYQLTGLDVVTLVGDNYIWSDSGNVTITE